jgi:formiminotetrahydrofolate cyclodeaminase
MQNASASISAFLDAAAARQPTPGGGAISALAGALAASMGEMVLSYSVNKKDLQVYRSELDSALGEFHRARLLLLGLMAEDQAAYAALTEARKLKDGSGGFDAALLIAIRVPQAIGATAIAMLEISGKLVEKVNHHLLSDLAVSTELAMATVRSASYNIHANLPDLTEIAERNRFATAADHMVARGVALIRDITPRIWARGASAT